MVMAGSGPHETSPHHAESANVHQQGELHDLEHGNDIDNQQEGSLQTLHTGGSSYRQRSHLVHEQANEKDLQQEIDDLKKIFPCSYPFFTPLKSILVVGISWKLTQVKQKLT